MALTDELNDQVTSQPGTEDSSQRRRMMEFILRSALKPALPPRPGSDASPGDNRALISRAGGMSSEAQPGSRGYNLALGATSQPTIPANRTAEAQPPDIRPDFKPPMAGPPSPMRPSPGPATDRYSQLLSQGPPQYHGFKKVLDILGTGTRVGQAIEEGTGMGSLGYQTRLGRAERGAKFELEAEKERAGEDLTAAQTEETRARTEALRNPKPEKPGAPHYQVDDEGKLHEIVVGPDGKPVDQIIPGSFGKPAPTPKPTFEEQNYAEWADTQKKAGKPSDRMTFERQLHPKDTSGREEARGDRSYQWHAGRIDKLREPITARMERVSRLEDTLNQGTPQADALVAPELLSVMAGGQGSGLRMNEAEIARIVGGRTNWETLKAKLGAWQLDPNKGFALTPDQREQTRNLFAVVKDRVSKKMAAIDEESEALSATDSAAEHRRIYNRLQKRLSDIDSGASSDGGSGGAVRFSDGGRNFAIPAGQVNEFLKDHPNAQRR